MTKVQQGKRKGKKVTSNAHVQEGRQLMLQKKKKFIENMVVFPSLKIKIFNKLPYKSMSSMSHLGAVQTKQSYSFPECTWSRNKKSHGRGKKGELSIRRKFQSEETWRNSRFSKVLRDSRRAGGWGGGISTKCSSSRVYSTIKEEGNSH